MFVRSAHKIKNVSMPKAWKKTCWMTEGLLKAQSINDTEQWQ